MQTYRHTGPILCRVHHWQLPGFLWSGRSTTDTGQRRVAAERLILLDVSHS